MRALVIDKEARAAVAQVVAHALEPENYYEPGLSPQPPGDDPRYIVLLNTFRCVFSITKAPDGRLFRHLSISVPTPGKYPNEFAVLEIARLFGFTGWDGHRLYFPDNWMIDANQEDECVILAQFYSPEPF
jgi:hypothetical protein